LANGVVGPIHINGPATSNYDVDLGAYPITDWYYSAADEILLSLIPPGTAPPPSDNVLFNGSNISPDGTSGQYSRVTLRQGQRHLLRIINTSVDNGFQISLVNHQFTVVGADFVPISPFNSSSLFLGVGQRYDVIIDASQDPGSYWFNVTFASNNLCGTSRNPAPAAIFQYEGTPTTIPTDPGTRPTDSRCEDTTAYTPVVTRTAPAASFTARPENSLDVNIENMLWENQQRVYWTVQGQDMNITWDEPTLEYLAKGNLSFPPRYNVFQVPEENQVRRPHKIRLLLLLADAASSGRSGLWKTYLVFR